MLFAYKRPMQTILRQFIYNPPQDPYLDICYEDEDIVICNKPSGLLSVPGRGEDKQDCLANRLREKYGEIFIVHRLDLETSGVIVFARNAEMQSALGKMFMERRVEKDYIADVYGELPGLCGVIELPLICDWPNRPRQIVDFNEGRPSTTKWTRLEQFENHARVKLKPVTGRTHQLRVHMQNLGHPMLGDSLYAPDEAFTNYSRLHLHAWRISFAHPLSRIPIEIETDCPF